MNEQLEKFVKQAPLLKSYDYPDLRLVDDDQLERFAELIIHECINICISNRHDDSALHIEEHFGVE